VDCVAERTDRQSHQRSPGTPSSSGMSFADPPKSNSQFPNRGFLQAPIRPSSWEFSSDHTDTALSSDCLSLNKTDPTIGPSVVIILIIHSPSALNRLCSPRLPRTPLHRLPISPQTESKSLFTVPIALDSELPITAFHITPHRRIALMSQSGSFRHPSLRGTIAAPSSRLQSVPIPHSTFRVRQTPPMHRADVVCAAAVRCTHPINSSLPVSALPALHLPNLPKSNTFTIKSSSSAGIFQKQFTFL
jgi:hypothetical protein